MSNEQSSTSASACLRSIIHQNKLQKYPSLPFAYPSRDHQEEVEQTYKADLTAHNYRATSKPSIISQEIESISLHNPIPLFSRIYGLPILSLYPLLYYTYYHKYDEWVVSEEWTFIYCVLLFAGHALSFLITAWSSGFNARISYTSANSLKDASKVRVIPSKGRGKGEIVPLDSKLAPGATQPTYSFIYQRDTYVYDASTNAFTPIPYPCDSSPPLSTFQSSKGILTHPSSKSNVPNLEVLKSTYGSNECHIPIPKFTELFAEHAVAPFFVFQIFCVALWCLDEYWYYSLFTAFMLVVFECTVVFQRVRTLTEFRTMSITPYHVQTFRDGKWVDVISSELVPGDVVSILRTKPDSGIPCDLLLLRGTCIVNEAMLSGESTPLLKESVELREGSDRLDMNGADRNSVLFSGTKALQVEKAGEGGLTTPDGGCLAVVLRTGFGTTQGQLVRTMIFSTERVSANTFEAFLFIGFLLIFAIAASAYVWVKGLERGMAKGKLLLDCVLIITSVVPPELPMELSLAVNASLVALQKYAIFCTEPFRIPFAGRVDVCCFDKTGTITGENLVVEGIAGIDSADPKKLVPVTETGKNTTLTLAAAHALVLLEDGTIVGDPMEKTTLSALDWKLSKGDNISPNSKEAPHKHQINIRRRYQFSSALKRMSTISAISDAHGRKWIAAVKGAPETLKGMYVSVPEYYEETYRWYTRRGSRVLALGIKEMNVRPEQINTIQRDEVESKLTFAGFLVFHCPLKPDAVETLKMLNDSSHRCIMITGDNPLTAVHVAKDVEIVDRETMILDLKEGTTTDELVWKNVDETVVIPVKASEPFDQKLFEQYDICITGAALKQYENSPSWHQLCKHTWVYARVSPSQKEFILSTLRDLGYITLMAGDGTNDVGALKQAHIGVALLDGSPEDLKAIAEHQKMERMKKVYEQQVKISARFNQPPPPPPPALREAYPELVKTQQEVAEKHQGARKQNPMEKFDMATITAKLSELDEDQEVPQIKLGDASCAAPFTSKLSNVSAITNIIRQGRCTLVATIQMYKILALNCLITAYSLSVQYLDGIKFGDYQVTITGMLMSVCFLCISRAKPVEKLSKERPLGNIFNFYVLLSVLLQFAIHIVALVYITGLSKSLEDRGEVDLEKKFEPTLLNTAIYLLGLSQQVSTFVLNFQGRPFREGIRENPPLYWGLLGVSAVAYSGATDFFPELNRWLQLVEMSGSFKFKLTTSMILDFVGCWAIEKTCKALFASLEPAELVTRGRERREKRRVEEEKLKAIAEAEKKEL
uniref:Cation-transporting ATPase 13A1 n=1 Tax=Kwoniella bestiolae CBS 10118 TaxID=1296100 RepID=A0A1B9G3J3_9TREE|nr:cation-transporting ATPase 13A1 [Kwoniella bestiolae CBS 10118]OCF25586.1 cation-transporting ATPase 13A1 [Kwoniella bestiolae CBS 10118]